MGGPDCHTQMGGDILGCDKVFREVPLMENSPRPFRRHPLPIRAQALRGELGRARFSASLSEGGGPQGRREYAPSGRGGRQENFSATKYNLRGAATGPLCPAASRPKRRSLSPEPLISRTRRPGCQGSRALRRSLPPSHPAGRAAALRLCQRLLSSKTPRQPCGTPARPDGRPP